MSTHTETNKQCDWAGRPGLASCGGIGMPAGTVSSALALPSSHLLSGLIKGVDQAYPGMPFRATGNGTKPVQFKGARGRLRRLDRGSLFCGP